MRGLRSLENEIFKDQLRTLHLATQLRFIPIVIDQQVKRSRSEPVHLRLSNALIPQILYFRGLDLDHYPTAALRFVVPFSLANADLPFYEARETGFCLLHIPSSPKTIFSDIV